MGNFNFPSILVVRWGAISPTYGSELSDLFLNTMNDVG